MPEGENPYHQPDVIRLSDELLEDAHARGEALVTRLLTGDTSPLPDTLRSWLTEHTMAINTLQIGTLRGEIADDLDATPPFTPGEAYAIGSRVLDLINVSNAAATQIELTDIVSAMGFGSFDDAE